MIKKKMPNRLVRAAQLQRERELGAELRARRKALGVSVIDMAESLGCTPAQLSRVEQGLPLIGTMGIREAMRIELYLRERAKRECLREQHNQELVAAENASFEEDPDYTEEELTAANTDLADSNLDDDSADSLWKSSDFS